jgi:serine protease
MAATSCIAQQFSLRPARHTSIEEGLRGKLIVKVTREAFATRPTSAMFGEATRRYGISSMSPWIPPKLLWYGTPMYKQGDAGSNETPEHSLSRIMVIEYSSLDAPERVAEAIEKMKGVEYAEPIYPRFPVYAPNDPELGKQAYLDAIKAREAWDVVRADSSIIIAIIDTGIERLHDDLKSAIWTNPKETGEGPNGDKRFDGIDNDDDSLIDDWWGWDFAGSNGSDPDNNPSGVEEHGTEVAGVAAAPGDNATGVAGVAFGAKLMAVKVGDDRLFPNNRIYNGALGIMYAAKKEADVLNCSWGGVNASRSEEEVVEYVVNDRHKLIVAAAGNDSEESDFYPASYAGVLNVAALTEGREKASFSNYSYRVDLSAPGTDVYSTGIGSTYRYDQGTSFSTPMVSGVAALIHKRFPSYSSEQIAEVLRATADDMSGTLNPAYAGKMGSGQLNAFRAVSEGGQIASARMVEYTIDESIPDGAVDAGETIRIRAKIKNLLADAPGVTATLGCVTDPGIQINGSRLELGAMASGETRVSTDTVFQLTIPPTTPPNTRLVLKLTLTTKDRAGDQYIILRAAPTFLTTAHNDVAVTFNSTGNIGHNGLNQLEGDGFLYNGSDDLLFHGGLMIGTDPDHLSDAVRKGYLSDGISDGFRIVRPYRLGISSDSSVEIGTAKFNDAHVAQEMRVGVDVEMKTYEYRAAGASNFVIVSYRITNTSSAPLHGLRCGLYLDWDVSESSFSDRVQYDAEHRLGFQRNVGGDAEDLFVGAALLTSQDISFYAAENYDDSINSAFYQSRKWAMLTSGIHENSTIDDMSMVIGAGPIDLQPNAWTEVAFALLAHEDFDSLRASADRARQLFVPSGVAVPSMPGILEAFAQPNPFSASTVIHVAPRRSGAATLAIYNLRGEKVASLFSGHLDAGTHAFPFGAALLPDGVYMYEFRSGELVQKGKIVKVR